MQIICYVRIKNMYGFCLVFNEIDPSVRPERKIYIGLTYAWNTRIYADWKQAFMWRSKL